MLQCHIRPPTARRPLNPLVPNLPSNALIMISATRSSVGPKREKLTLNSSVSASIRNVWNMKALNTQSTSIIIRTARCGSRNE